MDCHAHARVLHSVGRDCVGAAELPSENSAVIFSASMIIEPVVCWLCSQCRV